MHARFGDLDIDLDFENVSDKLVLLVFLDLPPFSRIVLVTLSYDHVFQIFNAFNLLWVSCD